ncbi:heme-binding protein [Bradyrhizobium sp. 521_C7_N1_3]|uniref:GlcG/HbpS family heme-binding protein n=1 Tax=Bradyrhizobium TaxID=374 RepID=UPI002714F445|nr:heme-binding protein [Bradyrhizobium japonicum]WLB61531.1 heme-binding protein [Bradyrhizobium japonicum]
MRKSIRLALAAVPVAVALQTQGVIAQFLEKKVLTLATAERIVAAGIAEAERNRLAGVIAVVDDGGWPILLVRMDNAAYIASVELAQGKARTAALFKKPTEALENAINQGRFENRARAMGDARIEVKERHLVNCTKADPAYGAGVARALGLTSDSGAL